jgi:hypothetical protein|nr:MAG TPA: hypothetical protein [Caudoviricetes sp.]
MYKENLTTNIMYSTEDIGNAFRKILERLNNKNNETIEVHHICSTCKHRCSETYITQDWGVKQAWHNWCGLDKKYMGTKFSQGNNKHFSEPCDHWEISDYFKEKTTKQVSV